jgi:hypothetical protein
MSTYDDAWLAQYLARGGRVVGAPAPPAPPVTEEPEGALLERLRILAVDTLGMLFYHPYSSKRSTPGWPDVALVRPAERLATPDEPSILYLLELKSTQGVVSPAQRRWLAALQRVTAVHAQAVWPHDYATLAALLMR